MDGTVTQHPVEAAPPVSIEVNGAPLPVVGRPRTARSVVVSLAFGDLVRLANADTFVQRTFDTGLEFGAGRLRMLRVPAQRSAGR